MNRFFAYANRYRILSPEEKQFITTHARVRRYTKHDYYLLTGEVALHWCFVLTGLVGGFRYFSDDTEDLFWIVGQNGYFTGTKHLFSNRSTDLDIKFLDRSEILQIPLTNIRYAQQHFDGISEFLHVLKQKKIEETKLLLAMNKVKDGVQRYIYFRNHFPHLVHQLSMANTCLYLNISNSTYKRGQRIYLQMRND